MDLRNGRITMGELWKNPQARAILQREFPEIAGNPMMLRMAMGMSLSRVIPHARKHYSQQKVDGVIRQLQAV